MSAHDPFDANLQSLVLVLRHAPQHEPQTPLLQQLCLEHVVSRDVPEERESRATDHQLEGELHDGSPHQV